MFDNAMHQQSIVLPTTSRLPTTPAPEETTTGIRKNNKILAFTNHALDKALNF